MNVTQLNFLFIGSCLGHEIEGTPKVGKLLHMNPDVDWHTKVYADDDEHYIVEEAFLDHQECKWSKNYYKVRKNTFSWNIELEGNQSHVVEEKIEETTLILK